MRRYRYVGPAELRDRVVADAVAVDARASLDVWLAGRDRGEGFAPAGAGWRVDAVTNQSTGYCPDPDCWPAVAAALDQAGVPHPGDFTDKVIFRRCPTCGERNLVRDGDYTCALCDGALPARWNVTSD